MPFLIDGVDDEDEVLVAIAHSLGKLIDHVGGPSHAQVLLPPLELLLTVGKYSEGRPTPLSLLFVYQKLMIHAISEEPTVRDAAAVSAQAIADILPDVIFQDAYVAMIGRLATLEWFTSRISASNLMAASYKRMTTQQQQQHVQYFAALCKDETPMVRRVASQHLGSMLNEVFHVNGRSCLKEGGTVGTILVPLYEELASNEQPVSRKMLPA